MVFDRVAYPRLAAVALVGFGWWLLGLILGAVGPDSLGLFASITHLLGLVTLVLCGIVYGIVWWSDYFQAKFG